MNDNFRQWKRDTFWYVIGFMTGAGVMIYVNSLVIQPTKPVVTVERQITGAVSDANMLYEGPPLAQVKTDEARHLQRVEELRFSLEKLERAKAVQDAFLKHAANNRDDIREMVAKLGENHEKN